MFRIGVCVCVSFLLVCSILPMAAQQTAAAALPAAVTYYGCINNSTGEIYLVAKATACKAGEHKISWNQVGPKGATGATGVTGAQGPAGPQGPAGISVGNFAFNLSHVALGAQTVVVQTNPIAVTGEYYVNATALLNIDAADTAAYCFVTIGSSGNTDGIFGGSSAVGHFQQASIADAWFVGAGDVIQLACFNGTGDANTYVYNASLSATLISSSFAAKKPKHSQHISSDPKAPK